MIGKAEPIIQNVGNFMSYLPGNLGLIGKTINSDAGAVDSFMGMLPSGMWDKVEQYTGKGSTSGNMATAINIINKSSGGNSNNRNITAAYQNAMGGYMC
ncbi:MAG: hypothetical protein Ta2E_11840 [Mycoplasmoidaceae bacterium]|nr:MAG: hypothetical protein Ta2E_11840 [Mycoplasmoidaceae bacterium]